MRFNYTALFLVFLIGVLIFISPPYILAQDVATPVRILISCVLTGFFLSYVLEKKKFVYFYLPFILFFLFELLYWKITGNSLESALYFLTYAILAVSMILSIHRVRGGRSLIINFYFWLVIITSVLCIVSFLAFNFGMLPFSLRMVGGEEGYKYFYFPVLGYINPKNFDYLVVGRACGYLLEPSYMGWFLTSNFFLIAKMLKDKRKIFFSQLIVFTGAMATVSTMMWLVFAAVFGIRVMYNFLKLTKLPEKAINSTLIFLFVIIVAVLPKDKILESLGPSSADDRDERVGVSFVLLATASVPDLMLGRSPSYIEKKFDKGESNQIVKMLVENGLISSVIVLIFIIYCTRKSKWYMLANILFLNSVVILFTPLFVFNILICKWLDDMEAERMVSTPINKL